MGSSVKNSDLNQLEEQVVARQEITVEPFVDEELPGTLESSGGSLELQAPHLQASTVTFTGVPSSPSSPVEVANQLPLDASASTPVDISCMKFYYI